MGNILANKIAPANNEFDKLPDHLILSIYMKLGDVENVSCTCRRMRHILMDCLMNLPECQHEIVNKIRMRDFVTFTREIAETKEQFVFSKDNDKCSFHVFGNDVVTIGIYKFEILKSVYLLDMRDKHSFFKVFRENESFLSGYTDLICKRTQNEQNIICKYNEI